MNKFILPALIILYPSVIFASSAGKVRSGNSEFKKGNYDKALDQYREAEISSPDNPVIHYNIGNSLYKLENPQDAENEYNKALNSKDKNIQSKTYYNLGNAAFSQGKNDEAIEYYKKALNLNPNDEDAKYNLEYIMKQKVQPQKNKKEGKDKKKEQKEKQSKEQKSKNGKDKKQNEKKENKNGMSKEDAERILNVFDESDRDSAKKRKMKMPEIPKVEYDW